MHELHMSGSRETRCRRLVRAVRDAIAGESDLIACLGNISAFIAAYIDDINWAGFYILRGAQLVLGPFQGKPACTRIDIGSGVCGTAAALRQAVIVPDVHAFPGHIACDTASNSEIVLPLLCEGELFGVLDIDSPTFDRFGELEQACLGEVAGLISAFLPGAR